MRKILVVTTLFLGVLTGRAQEKVMNIQKTDGTITQTRVADLKQISFLAVEDDGQGLLVKTSDGEMAAVLFESNPVVTVSSGKLTIKSSSADAVEFEIENIAEIQFGDVSEVTAIAGPEGTTCVVQDGCVLLRDIPTGIEPRICTADGRSIPVPPFAGNQLRLSRATLGTGIFIVRIGAFSAKIKF